MESHFRQREGSNTTDRFMLVETRGFNPPTSDGPHGSNAESIFLLQELDRAFYTGRRF